MSVPPSPYGPPSPNGPSQGGNAPQGGSSNPQGSPSYGSTPQGSPYGAPAQGSPYAAPQQGSPYAAPQQQSAQPSYGTPAPQSAAPSYGAPAPQSNAPSYGAPQQGGSISAPYGGAMPRQKRRGIKRMIFGGLGVVVNGMGLLIMPLIIGFLGGVIGIAGAMSNFPTVEGSSTTVQADTMLMYVMVPASDPETSCIISGPGVTEVKPGDHTIYTQGGTDWREVAQITTRADGGQIDITCPGASGIGYIAPELGGFLGGGLVGVIIPLFFGALALALLIWGIVAFVRSKPKAF